MVDFELGKEIENDVFFCLVTSVGQRKYYCIYVILLYYILILLYLYNVLYNILYYILIVIIFFLNNYLCSACYI